MLRLFVLIRTQQIYIHDEIRQISLNTVEPRYLELAYFELPLISK